MELPTFGVTQTNEISGNSINRKGVAHLTSYWYVLLSGQRDGLRLPINVFHERQGSLVSDIGADTPLESTPVDTVVVAPADSMPIDQGTNFSHHRVVVLVEISMNDRLGNVAVHIGKEDIDC